MADSILYLDVETTGKAKAYDQVAQVAYASEVDGELVDERCVLVRPSIPISPEAIEVHGITDEMVSGAPTFADAAGDLVESGDERHLGGPGVGETNLHAAGFSSLHQAHCGGRHRDLLWTARAGACAW